MTIITLKNDTMNKSKRKVMYRVT